MHLPVGWPFLLKRTPGAVDVGHAELFAAHVARRAGCRVGNTSKKPLSIKITRQFPKLHVRTRVYTLVHEPFDIFD